MFSDEEWFDYYDSTKDKFMWFIDMYFDCGCRDKLEIYRAEKNKTKMLKVLDKIWFELPDNTFNIKVMPRGWAEFLNLIEQ